VDEEQAGGRVHGQVAQRVEHAVAGIVGNPQPIVADFDEARPAAAVGGVEQALRIGGGDEDDVGTGDDPSFLGAEVDAERGGGAKIVDAVRADADVAAGDVLRAVGECLTDVDDDRIGGRV